MSSPPSSAPGQAPWARIRQICLAAPQLEPAVQALQSALGLQVAHRDPAVGKYGLENAVLPIGPHQFLEVVAPTREGTAVGRFLDRLLAPAGGPRGADAAGDQLGAYMLICDCDDPAAAKARAEGLGIRVVNDYHYPDYHGVQLHPRDTGAVMVEFNATPGGDDLNGPYHPAGHGWQAAVTTASGGMQAVRVQASDPAAMARQWAALFGQPARAVAGAHGVVAGFVIELALGRIEIGPLAAGAAGASLSEIVLSRAPANFGKTRTLCGVRVSV